MDGHATQNGGGGVKSGSACICPYNRTTERSWIVFYWDGLHFKMKVYSFKNLLYYWLELIITQHHHFWMVTRVVDCKKYYRREFLPTHSSKSNYPEIKSSLWHYPALQQSLCNITEFLKNWFSWYVCNVEKLLYL